MLILYLLELDYHFYILNEESRQYMNVLLKFFVRPAQGIYWVFW